MGQGPLKKISAGSVSCALWENEVMMNGRKASNLKATVERRYKDSSGTWKSANSFSRNEIPLVIYCLEKAFAVMIEERNVGENGER